MLSVLMIFFNIQILLYSCLHYVYNPTKYLILIIICVIRSAECIILNLCKLSLFYKIVCFNIFWWKNLSSLFS